MARARTPTSTNRSTSTAWRRSSAAGCRPRRDSADQPKLATSTRPTWPDLDALAARRERERWPADRYFGGLPAERKAALFAKWHATGRRDYEITLAVADQH